ncbi:MAG TPA: cbb3-type cytochrome c oxidase subunit I, partial [Candidatus Polarisedimenticolia bacterium]|nr:cbb3-type cytochrome c oxidase subunit I [Candidatus Polarisedimenticolia bacterium]
LAALVLAGISAVLVAINFVTTILNMRASGMSLHRMPLYVWSILVTSAFLLLWLPVLGGAVTVLVSHQNHAALFVEPAGGRPDVNRYAFWFLVHPEVYVLLLPSFGIVSQIVATFSRRPVLGRLALAYAMVAMGFVGFIAWAQQLYAGDIAGNARSYFIFISIVIALPASLSIVSWLVTMWRGAVSFRTPMLWALGFVFLLSVGALTGVADVGMTRAAPDAHLLRAHFQYVLALGAVFTVFANWFYWFPKITGLLFNEPLAKLQFWVTFVGVNLAIFTQHFLGLVVTLRRFVGYPNADAGWQQLTTVGSDLTLAGLGLFVVCMAEAVLRRNVANQNPWKATTGEWTTL